MTRLDLLDAEPGTLCPESILPSTSAQNSILSNVLYTVILPLLGMSFFWAFMRQPNFFMQLYPSSETFSVGSVALPTYTAYLVALVILMIICLKYWRQIEHFIDRHRVTCAGATLLGTIGALIAFIPQWSIVSQDSPLWHICIWLASVLVAVGFLAALFMWTSYFSRKFGTQELIIMTSSYVISLLLFQNVSRPLPPIQVILTVSVPLVSGLCWLFTKPHTEPHYYAQENSLSIKLLGNPIIWLFIAFLLIGSILRGVVDIVGPRPSLRPVMSIPVACILVGACIVYAYISNIKKEIGIPSFILCCWVGFSIFFFIGVCIMLISGDFNLGGSIVVIARSMLSVCFCILLCDYAYRSKIAYLPLFCVCMVVTNSASWLLSYIVVPLLTSGSFGSNPTSPQTLVLVSVFGLLAIVTVTCGMLLVLLGRKNLSIPAKDWIPSGSQHSATVFSHAEAEDQEWLAQELEKQHNLTPRESDVAVLYARGYSLVKVSEELGITNAAAQSHIKNVYKKLGIHTKNQLIEITESLKTQA